MIVDQQLSSEQQVEVKRLGLSGKMISFPLVSGIFIWPFQFGEHPQDAVISSHLRRVFSGWCGDKYLDRAIRAGENPDAILQAYTNLDVVNDARIDRLYELAKLQQIRRMSNPVFLAGVDFEPAFQGSDVPFAGASSLKLFTFVAARLFRVMGVSRTQVEDALARCRSVRSRQLKLPFTQGDPALQHGFPKRLQLLFLVRREDFLGDLLPTLRRS